MNVNKYVNSETSLKKLNTINFVKIFINLLNYENNQNGDKVRMQTT